MNQKAKDRIKEELDTVDTHELYDRYLNDLFPVATVCCEEIRGKSAEILKTYDKTAYRLGYNDWIEREQRDKALLEVDGEYYDFTAADQIVLEVAASVCAECGDEKDTDCNGEPRCPTCDGPCPCCTDGGGPGTDADGEDTDTKRSNSHERQRRIQPRFDTV